MKKISVRGGAPVILCDAVSPRGGSWGEDGYIVAALNQQDVLSKVLDSGGTPQRLTKLGRGEITHRWPQVLPGGQAVLFTASPTNVGQDDANIEVVSKTGVTKVLHRGGSYGRYLPSGHLVYVHQGVLFGLEFNAERLEVRGTTTPLVEDVADDSGMGGGQFDFSQTGTLVYVSGKEATPGWPIVWLNSSGKIQPLLTTPGAYYFPRFSPNSPQLALAVSSKGSDIFVYDWQRKTPTRLTFDRHSYGPVWHPDGKHIAFRSTSAGFNLCWVRSDGAGEPQQLLESQNNLVPYSFSPDGRWLAYQELRPGIGFDIWTLPLDITDPDHPKPGKPAPFLRTPSGGQVPAFSPDGRWIAYRSNDESGAYEIYVRPFPGPGAKWRISTGGGLYAFWSKISHELFYETADSRIMVVDYALNGEGGPAVGLEKNGIEKELQSLKWNLWHGNVERALERIEDLQWDLELTAGGTENRTKLLKQLGEFNGYIQNNREFIPNYGERYRNGERIATGFVESTVNQVVSKRMVKKQQMAWTERGAQLLLQTRTRVLNGELEETFRRWYPQFRPEPALELKAAA